jgi:transposase
MGWTVQHRRDASRSGLRYPSDLTDAEWALIEPLIPPARRGGRPRTVDMREVVNAIFYVLGTGCQWAALPRDLPPRSTVFDYFGRWSAGPVLWRIHDHLFEAERRRQGRRPGPTLGIIDAQAVAGAPKGGRSSLRATTGPRRSRAASATSSSTRTAFSSPSTSPRPTFRTATAQHLS